MTAPIAAGRTGGVSFRLLGVPVTIHVTFLLVLGILGIGLGDAEHIAVWVGVALASVLLHEFGHALVGRAFGMTPRIDLAGMGGMTSWSGERHELSRPRSFLVSAAGPGIGIVGGLVALAAGTDCCRPDLGASLGDFAASTWVYVSFAWGALNLLPILPLDGGRIAEALMPGDPLVRRLRTARFSIAVSVVVALAAAYAGLVFAAVLLGFFAWNNIRVASTLRDHTSESAALQRDAAERARRGDVAGALEAAEQAARVAGSAAVRASAASLVVHLLIDNGRTAEALALAADPRPGLVLSESSVGRALAAADGTAAAAALLEQVRESPDGVRVRGILAMRLAFLGDFFGAEEILRGGPVGTGIAETIRALRPDA